MDHKLKIFKSVAHHSSFTKAAEQLFISQPAISKAIRNLEDEYNTTFFIRKRNSIELTQDGKSFLIYVNRILEVYSEIENRFIHKDNQLPDRIKFGASTTLASYIIPKIIAQFRTQYPKTSFEIESDNSDHIEELILNQQLDFGITEGKNTNPKLHFKKFIKDEIVLVTNEKNSQFPKGIISLKKLQELPIIERESGSGTREIIYEALLQQQIKSLQIAVTLNSTEAIKNYLYYSDSYALLSIHAIREDLITNKLKIIDIKGFTIERWFYFVSRTGYKSSLMDYFERFVQNSYNF
ncbi:LysR substrate-binding domain-containing protein [Cellulophaga baltica]|uniref:DNA-binding transcriptional regulator, LysR family n=1 Tax=Cellulophaga baltica TaxID=76594 RepID=A0A1G7G688_9FLAO|nr:LysR substrate-binding domain-containing protein [Cellulophaga baltica]MBA6315601.1 LysR family transcriptional regulator [Cellulophaga baltica]SDE83641.1 DNA-binding transcriptional regulator, LysR family [Cellulophaga baltica]